MTRPPGSAGSGSSCRSPCASATTASPPCPSRSLEPEPYGNLHGLPRRTCSLCGECDIGCNSGAKNTLDHTYLSAAADAGAMISPLSEVRAIRRLDRGFEVTYQIHRPGEVVPKEPARRSPSPRTESS